MEDRRLDTLLEDWRNRRVRVYRITVDEKLTTNHVRLLICPLASDIEKYANRKTNQILITDRARNWDAEEEFILTQNKLREFLPTLGLMAESIIPPDWDSLKESQVFYAGHVRCEEIRLELSAKSIKGKPNEIEFEKGAKMRKKYVVDLDQWNLYQIDDITKEANARLYFSILKTGRRHASSTN